jgi:hypothetical protein
MDNKAYRQHQSLRVPAGWSGQDRALVIQMERLLDDIYSRISKNREMAVTNVAYDSSTKKLTLTVNYDQNAVISDIVAVATLDGNGKIPANQLPSYVDDVEEYADFAHFPVTGESDKIYVALDTGFTYRWSGTQYVRLNTYDEATQSSSGLMSAADKTKLDGVEEGATANIGTITSVKMNGSTVSSGGEADLGTVITAHQDISGKADKSETVSTVAYDSENKKITKTINGTTTDVVTVASIQSALGSFTWGALAGQ